MTRGVETLPCSGKRHLCAPHGGPPRVSPEVAVHESPWLFDNAVDLQALGTMPLLPLGTTRDAAASVPSNSAGVAAALNELVEALVSTEEDEGEDGGDEGEVEDNLISTDSEGDGELQLLLDVHLVSSSSDDSGGEDDGSEDAAE